MSCCDNAWLETKLNMYSNNKSLKGGRCRFQLLLCSDCLPKHGGEHFCFSHVHLTSCYSKFCIPTFASTELVRRITLLKEKEKELLPLGRNGRARRRTIRRCYMEMEQVLADKLNEKEQKTEGVAFCRSSGKVLSECKGDCWGFYGKNSMDST